MGTPRSHRCQGSPGGRKGWDQPRPSASHQAAKKNHLSASQRAKNLHSRWPWAGGHGRSSGGRGGHSPGVRATPAQAPSGALGFRGEGPGPPAPRQHPGLPASGAGPGRLSRRWSFDTALRGPTREEEGGWRGRRSEKEQQGGHHGHAGGCRGPPVARRDQALASVVNRLLGLAVEGDGPSPLLHHVPLCSAPRFGPDTQPQTSGRSSGERYGKKWWETEGAIGFQGWQRALGSPSGHW